MLRLCTADIAYSYYPLIIPRAPCVIPHVSRKIQAIAVLDAATSRSMTIRVSSQLLRLEFTVAFVIIAYVNALYKQGAVINLVG
jgi:hypothetical protein